MARTPSHPVGSLILLLNRVPLGLLFLLAGVRKLLPKPDGSVMQSLNGFASYAASQAPLPEALGKAYGYALPFVEIIAGGLLILGLLTRVSALVIGLMLLSFMVAMGINWWPESGPAFDKNVILFTLSLLLVMIGGGAWSLDAVRGKRGGASSAK